VQDASGKEQVRSGGSHAISRAVRRLLLRFSCRVLLLHVESRGSEVGRSMSLNVRIRRELYFVWKEARFRVCEDRDVCFVVV
jgi:predicted component of type VI protein secretion system